MSQRVTIIGGGIAGLSSAWFLEQGGACSCTLVEAGPRLGGTIRTLREDGFLVEAGPDSVITTKPHGVELVKSLGLEGDLVEPTHRRFFVFHRGRLRAVPAGFASLAPGSARDILASDLLTLAGKLRVLSEPFRRKGVSQGDESIRSFFERRLGREFARIMAEPLFAGIHAGQGDQLSMRALLPQFLAMESRHGSLARAVSARQKATSGKRQSVFVSLKNGMESLVSALVAQMSSVNTRTECPAVRIAQAADGTFSTTLSSGEELDSEHVIIATHAAAAAALLEGLDPEVATQLRSIPYASTAAVTLAMRSADVKHPLDATGCLVPGELQMTACTWSASKWAGRAPEGHALFRCFYGRHGDDDALSLDDAALVALSESELGRMLAINGAPTHRWVHRWDKAMPQYTVGHLDRIDAIEQGLAPFHGIHLVGAGYRGVGIPDCVGQARATAERIAGLKT